MNFVTSKPAFALFGAAAGATIAGLVCYGFRKNKKQRKIDQNTEQKVCQIVPRVQSPSVQGPEMKQDEVETKSPGTSGFDQLNKETVLYLLQSETKLSRGPLVHQLSADATTLAAFNDVDAVLHNLFSEKKTKVHLATGQMGITQEHLDFLWPRKKLAFLQSNQTKEWLFSTAPGTDTLWISSAHNNDNLSCKDLKERFHALFKTNAPESEQQSVSLSMNVIPHTLGFGDSDMIKLKYSYLNKPFAITFDRPMGWWSGTAKNDFTWFFAKTEGLTLEDARAKAKALTKAIEGKFKADWKSNNTDQWPDTFGATIFEHCRDLKQFAELIVHFFSHSVPLVVPEAEEKETKESVEKQVEEFIAQVASRDFKQDDLEKIFKQARVLGCKMRPHFQI